MANNSNPKRRDNYSSSNICDLDGAKKKKAGYPMQDERTSNIQGKAALGTYYISLAFMVSILVWNIFGNEFLNFLPELDTGWTVIAIMLVSGFSFGLLSWYYAKKGEL